MYAVICDINQVLIDKLRQMHSNKHKRLKLYFLKSLHN